MIHALLFDLDDTLYREFDFVLSGYRAVARYVFDRYGRSYDRVYRTMVRTLMDKDRDHVFPVVREVYLDSMVSIGELVEVYRRHSPEIALFPGYDVLLQQLRRRYRIGIVTDGLPEVQRSKSRALGLEDAVDAFVYTWEHGRDKEKPHPHPFLLMLSLLHANPSQAVFIGDNYIKDCEGARKVGMGCVLVGSAAAGDSSGCSNIVIESLFQLPEVLNQLEKCHAVS
jgi:putative hydrolase of the HAD superfamily